MAMETTEAPELVLATCGHLAPSGSLRRGLCDACYRKLRAEGCPLPPKGSRWDDYDGLAAWARALPDDVRRRLLAALMETR
jgi:hypothetical protein